MIGRLPKYESKERPYINSQYIPTTYSGEPRELNLDALIYWVKNTPECIGILKRIATDIVTNFEFIAIEQPNKGGRPKKNYDGKTEDKALAFSKRNFLKQKLLSAIIDWLMTGDAYIWKGRLSDKQVKEHLKENYGIDAKESEFKQFFDEDWNGVNAIEVAASSMVEIDHDNFKIKKYVQKSKSNPEKDIEWKPEEIIHAKFMEIDSKVYGFSPMQASYTAIKTINAIQDYGYNYFANGVKLDRAWMFSGNVNQTYMDKFEEVLEQYKKTRHAHGDLIVAGGDKITVEKLNEAAEEMEYRQLAIHSVGRLAFAFNMPADILSSILGVDVQGTAVGSDIEDAGYNRNIEQSQTYWEDLLNYQLFNKEFKVDINFERSFKQDLIKERQYQVQTVPVIDFLFKHEIPVTDEYIFDLMNIPRKYREKGTIKREVEEAPGIPVTPQNVKGPNQEKFSDTKKLQQKPQQNNNPPTGKEKVEVKEITYLNPDTFLDEIQRWGINQDSQIRVRVMRKGNKVYMKFPIPNTAEEVRSVIPAERWDSFDWMQLGPVSITAVWDEKLNSLLTEPEEKREKKKPEKKKVKVVQEKYDDASEMDKSVKNIFDMGNKDIWRGF